MTRGDLVRRDPRAVDRHEAVACAAGPPRLPGEPSATWSTVVVAFPADVMKSTVKMTIASTMFAAGPAAIAATRFQVGARQYAFGPRASSRSSRLLRGGRLGARLELLLVDELPEDAHRVARGVVVACRERGPEAVAWARRAPARRRRPGRRRCRRRPARAGACRGSSRSRRAGSRRGRTRSRSASSSRSRAGSRCRTAAGASRARARRGSARARG